MFKWSYKYTLKPDKNVITLTPTFGTWMKAFAPSILCAVGFGAMYVIGAIAEKKDAEAYEEHMESLVKDE